MKIIEGPNKAGQNQEYHLPLIVGIDNPTILEECQLRIHVDHVENMLCDSYFVELSYDPTCNY